jgi:YesN/AraC family two-component response regulator
MRTSVLFVDDEKLVLRGVRRTMLLLDSEIECRFAESGQDAIDLLSQEKADIIISDMKMPGMDGGALLKKVKDNWPNTFRVIMSGQSERDLTMKSLGVSHNI